MTFIKGAKDSKWQEGYEEKGMLASIQCWGVRTSGEPLWETV